MTEQSNPERAEVLSEPDRTGPYPTAGDVEDERAYWMDARFTPSQPRSTVLLIRKLYELLAAQSKLIAEREERFQCGHRVADWDNSYGSCVACSFIAAAHEHDDCPDARQDCQIAQARIEAVTSERDGAREAIRRAWPHLTGHCLEGATPRCFAAVRDALAAVVPDLPYTDAALLADSKEEV